jgi:hypothetical protein
MTTLIMRDSVTPSAIPIAGTQIACGYIDGDFKNYAALELRFPDIRRVLVDALGTAPGAAVRDWETGDKAGSLVEWITAHNALGAKNSVVYCNRSTIPEVRQLTGSLVLGEDYYLWIATLDGSVYSPTDLAGVVACQDKGATQDHANYDESVVWPTPEVVWTQPLPVVVPVESALLLLPNLKTESATSTDGIHWTV